MVNCTLKLKQSMIKFRYLFLIVAIGVFVYACNDDDETTTTTTEVDFDHEEQAGKDNDSIVEFLKNHYYNADLDSVKPLTTGQTDLHSELGTKLFIQNITENDIEYQLYYYIQNKGVDSTFIKDNDTIIKPPTIVDHVFVKYYGQRIVNADSLSTVFDRGNHTWIKLAIRGWAYGLTNFRGGINTTKVNGPYTFEGEGKGLLFIPSGLAYGNNGSLTILPNEPLMFNVNLYDYVPDSDYDEDGIPSILEDLDKDGLPWNDDTDGDTIPNYGDNDDDQDGILTIFEDANNDGDPTNDFNGDNKTLPDYLNPEIANSNQ